MEHWRCEWRPTADRGREQPADRAAPDPCAWVVVSCGRSVAICWNHDAGKCAGARGVRPPRPVSYGSRIWAIDLVTIRAASQIEQGLRFQTIEERDYLIVRGDRERNYFVQFPSPQPVTAGGAAAASLSPSVLGADQADQAAPATDSAAE